MKFCKASEISKFLKTKFYGDDLIIKTVTSLDNIKNNALVFSKKKNISIINLKVLILVPLNFEYSPNFPFSIIKVKNPRLEFAKVLQKFFVQPRKKIIHSSTIIGKDCEIDKSVSIGINCVIGNNVKIGKNTMINHNVVLHDNVIIGDSCYINFYIIFNNCII